MIPKATLRFDDSLEGLRDLSKAVIFVCKVYYSKKIQVKISKGNRHIEHTVQKRLAQTSSCPLSLESYRQCLALLVMMYGNMCELLPTREDQLSLDVRGVYWGVSQVGVEHHMADFSDSVCSLPPPHSEVKMTQ